MSEPRLTHLDEAGHARMVDVGDKDTTRRVAVASAALVLRPDTARMLVEGRLPKGDAIATARIAGIMAAKRTPDLIPLCHVVSLSGVEVEVDVDVDVGRCRITATATAADRTGVEMEALVAASTTAGSTGSRPTSGSERARGRGSSSDVRPRMICQSSRASGGGSNTGADHRALLRTPR